MNCKPNQLARVVGTNDKNADKLVRTIELTTDHRFKDMPGPIWRIEVLCEGWDYYYHRWIPAGTLCVIRDCQLRPFQDPDDEVKIVESKPVEDLV